jgi:hypothetical protein
MLESYRYTNVAFKEPRYRNLGAQVEIILRVTAARIYHGCFGLRGNCCEDGSARPVSPSRDVPFLKV